jgi:hypothetical protein
MSASQLKQWTANYQKMLAKARENGGAEYANDSTSDDSGGKDRAMFVNNRFAALADCRDE